MFIDSPAELEISSPQRGEMFKDVHCCPPIRSASILSGALGYKHVAPLGRKVQNHRN